MDADFRVGQWLVQPQLNLIQGPGRDTSVEPKAMEVLVSLSQRAGEVVPKELLMQTVWADTFVTDEVLTNSIWELRKAFGDDAKNPKVNQTVFKKGYRLIAPVSFGGKTSETKSISEPSRREAASRPALHKGKLQGRRSRKWIIAAVVLVTLTLGGVFSLKLLRRIESGSATTPKIVPLTSFPGKEIHAAFSPDGSQIAFAWNHEEEDNYDIYVKVIGSETLLRLTNSASIDEMRPAWSPDGRSIAFVRYSRTHTSIVLIRALGGPQRELYSIEASVDPFAGLSLSWSPDGKMLAVSEPLRGKHASRIFLYAMDTGMQQTSSPPTQIYRQHTGCRVFRLMAKPWPSLSSPARQWETSIR
jgi:DNA-binding winged helix-turn-helix (wHTH) protein